MARAAHALLVAGLAALLAAGCRGSGGSSGCRNPGEPFCWCPAGASCSQVCSGPTCALDCANGNLTCTLHGGDACSASCQGAQSCSVTCGSGSLVACQHVGARCVASVGDGSRALCEGAALCDVTCTGGCDVDCPGGHCRVRCADPSRCHLACDTPVTACPDAATRVCGLAC